MSAVASAAGECVVEGDTVEPREEAAVLLERIQFEVRLDERFLDDIFGFVGVPYDADHGRIESVLVTTDQSLKG
jgi:hypothetical protein